VTPEQQLVGLIAVSGKPNFTRNETVQYGLGTHALQNKSLLAFYLLIRMFVRLILTPLRIRLQMAADLPAHL
jgi:hypothetical protein